MEEYSVPWNHVWPVSGGGPAQPLRGGGPWASVETLGIEPRGRPDPPFVPSSRAWFRDLPVNAKSHLKSLPKCPGSLFIHLHPSSPKIRAQVDTSLYRHFLCVVDPRRSQPQAFLFRLFLRTAWPWIVIGVQVLHVPSLTGSELRSLGRPVLQSRYHDLWGGVFETN